MTPRPPLRAGQGNRRRRPPAQAAARRHARWLLNQIRRGVLIIRGLPARMRGRIAWRQAGAAVAERGRAIVPVARRALEGVSKGLDRGASELGRSAAAGGRSLRSLSHLGALGAHRLSLLSKRCFAQTLRLSRSAGTALAYAARRVGTGSARLSRRFAAFLWERRALLRALALRAAWWSALALLWLGGRTVLDLQAPLAHDALPLFLAGLALCLPLLFAAAARLRWAGFALGAGHAALAVLVWAVTTSG